MNNSINQQGMSQVDSSINNLNKMADSIPNYNVWTRLAKAGLKGYGSYLSSNTKKKMANAQAKSLMFESITANMNADFAEKQAELNARSSTEQMYNVYRMGEHQAMLQGLRDAQVIHGNVASRASSGTRSDVGSNADIRASDEMSAEINRATIQENTINSANALRYQASNARVQGILEKANYQAQALILAGDSRAQDIVANAIKPYDDAIMSFTTSMLDSYQGNFSQMGGDFSKMFSFGGK